MEAMGKSNDLDNPVVHFRDRQEEYQHGIDTVTDTDTKSVGLVLVSNLDEAILVSVSVLVSIQSYSSIFNIGYKLLIASVSDAL